MSRRNNPTPPNIVTQEVDAHFTDRRAPHRAEAEAIRENLFETTVAQDPYNGRPNLAEIKKQGRRAERGSMRNRLRALGALGAVATAVVAGALVSSNANAVPTKAPASITADQDGFTARAIATEKAVSAQSQERQRVQAAERASAIANSTASEIIKMTAADPHLELDNGGEQSDMYAWDGDYQHPELEVSRWQNGFSVSAINMPGGENGTTWNNISIVYAMPESVSAQLGDKPMTATTWEHINLGDLQLQKMEVDAGGISTSNTLTATNEGYSLNTHDGGGSSTAITQSQELNAFDNTTTTALHNLQAAQASYN